MKRPIEKVKYPLYALVGGPLSDAGVVFPERFINFQFRRVIFTFSFAVGIFFFRFRDGVYVEVRILHSVPI